MLRTLSLLAMCVLILLQLGCQNEADSWPEGDRLRVVVSFPPVYCFVANVVGDNAHVRTIMTSHGPHHFDPKPQDVRRLSGAKLFFINGLELDNRASKKLLQGSGNQDLQLIDLGSRLPADLLQEGQCNHDHGSEPHDHGFDPHVWLGLDLAAKMVDSVRDDVKKADPAHAADYDRRASAYSAKLSQLRDSGREQLKSKKERKIVSFHESLTYFARSLDLQVADVIQKVPGKEPSSKELEALIASCIAHKVRVIAVEPQYSGQSSAKRILDELKRAGISEAVLVEIDPLETAIESELNPSWYETKMKANIEALVKVLQ